MEKLATLETTNRSISPLRNCSYNFCRCLVLVSPLISGGAPSRSASSSNCSTYWPITSRGTPACWATRSSTTRVFDSAVEASR